MNKQEVITIIRSIPSMSEINEEIIIQHYPVIEEALASGKYIESMSQTVFADKTFIITFIIRHYN